LILKEWEGNTFVTDAASGRLDLEVRDDGCGLSDFDTLFCLARSGWDLEIVTREQLERLLFLQIEEAVYYLFTWAEGTFNFESDIRPEEQDFLVSINPESLLLEGALLFSVGTSRRLGGEGPARTVAPFSTRGLSAGYGSAEGSDFFSATTSSWRDSLP